MRHARKCKTLEEWREACRKLGYTVRKLDNGSEHAYDSSGYVQAESEWLLVYEYTTDTKPKG